MFGIKMKNKEDENINQIIEEEIIIDFENKRNILRKDAKTQILKIQKENQNSFNKKRKPANKYNIGDLVAIQRTQFGVGLKVVQKYLGPYEVTKIKRVNRYDVKKVGNGEGPILISTSADLMKPWTRYDSDSSGTDEE